MKELLIDIRGKNVVFPYHVQPLEPNLVLEGITGLVTFASRSDDIMLSSNDELAAIIAQICQKEELVPHTSRFFHLSITQVDGRPNGCFAFDFLITEFQKEGRPQVSFTQTHRCPPDILATFSEFLPNNPYQVGIPHGDYDPFSAAG